MRRLSIRWRLTLWYGAVLSMILIGFSVAVYLMMQRHLLALTDATLREELDELAAEVKRAEDLSNLRQILESRFPVQEGYELQVGAVTGEPLFRSVGIGSTGLPKPVALRTGLNAPTYESVTLDGHRPVRLASRMVLGPSGSLLIQAGVTLVPNARALNSW